MVGSSSPHLRAPAACGQALGSAIPVFPVESGILSNRSAKPHFVPKTARQINPLPTKSRSSTNWVFVRANRESNCVPGISVENAWPHPGKVGATQIKDDQ